MGLEIIGAGFGRTGTLSLKAALEQLGFGKCYHMLDVAEDTKRAGAWLDAARGKAVDWEEVFAGYRSTVDWPGAKFYRELAGWYPTAKVILSVRDTESWYKSASETLYPVAQSTPKWLAWVAPQVRKMVGMTRAVIWDGTFKGQFKDAAFAKQVYEDHNAQVQAVIEADRLLVHRPADGWAPLCAFLGVPVPDTPYPHVNNAEELRATVAKLMRVHKLGAVGALVVAAVVAVSVYLIM